MVWKLGKLSIFWKFERDLIFIAWFFYSENEIGILPVIQISKVFLKFIPPILLPVYLAIPM